MSQLKLYTSADLKNWPEEAELLEGDIIEPSLPSLYHTKLQRYILQQLDKFDPESKLGLMLQEPSIEFDLQNTPRPDLAFWRQDNLPAIDLEFSITHTIPNLVIEVLSPRDLEGIKHHQETMSKIRLYQVGGVNLIWVINPMDKEVALYVPGQIAPLQTLLRNSGERLEAKEIIPGFALKVDELFDS